HRANLVELAAKRANILVRPHTGMDAFFNGIVFGRQSKRVPSHGVEHFIPLQGFVTAPHVRQDIPTPMADVQPRPRGIGKHVQAIVFGPWVSVGHHMHPTLFPTPTPFSFDFLRFIRLVAHRSRTSLAMLTLHGTYIPDMTMESPPVALQLT